VASLIRGEMARIYSMIYSEEVQRFIGKLDVFMAPRLTEWKYSVKYYLWRSAWAEVVDRYYNSTFSRIR
jgi:hypothetical protein